MTRRTGRPGADSHPAPNPRPGPSPRPGRPDPALRAETADPAGPGRPRRSEPLTRDDLSSWGRGDYDRLSPRTDILGPLTHPDVRIERGIPVAAPDGAVLLTDHVYPSRGALGSTVLVRTPYGRDSMGVQALLLAQRGHHVVIQGCRGTFGSGGVFAPFHDEVADGRAALAWVRAQPWATGAVHTFGGSYVGYTQWAQVDAPRPPDAMTVAVSARSIGPAMFLEGGGVNLETMLAWVISLDSQEEAFPTRTLALARGVLGLRRAALTVPPDRADAVVLGHASPDFRDWMAHLDPADPWWRAFATAQDIDRVPPTVLIAGWQDLFLREQVRDFQALRRAGRPVRLVIGEWTHMDAGMNDVALGLAARQLRDADAVQAGPPVQVLITGGGGWRDLERWPPPAAPARWVLTAPGGLEPEEEAPPSSEGRVGFRYDPAHPTPQGGGRTLNPFTAGRRRQGRRERRGDVLVFTSEPLARDFTMVGEAEATLMLSSTVPRPDLFLRLCEVDARGRSRTVADAYRRLPPGWGRGSPDEDDAEAASAGHPAVAGTDRPASTARRNASGGARHVTLAFDPAAHRFRAGTRLRLQVSGGAHPLHLRNPGTADPSRDFSHLVPSDQTLRVGGRDGCVLTLPLVDQDDTGQGSIDRPGDEDRPRVSEDDRVRRSGGASDDRP